MTALEDDEEAAEKAADEERQLGEAWKELVKSVLSSIRIDPKSKGRQFEFFLPYEDEVTPEQVAALKRSSYGTSFTRLCQLAKHLPEKDRPEIYQLAELFKMLSTISGSPYREISYLEKDKKEPLTQLALLNKMSFLVMHSWSEHTQFDVDDLSEQLNTYIAYGIEWRAVEHKILSMCIQRAADEHKAKAKPLSETVGDKVMKQNIVVGAVVMASMMFAGFLLPILFGLAINVGIAVWSLNHLSGENASLWAYVGLCFVAITVPATIIHYGTTELRHLLHKIAEPGWDRHKPSMNADLHALNKTVNAYRSAHTNVRLVREQLVRLQNTDIKMPVQLITLIDRSIAKGHHYW